MSACGIKAGRALTGCGLGAAALFAATVATTVADAAVVDQARFRASGLVIVFGASDTAENGGVAPFVSDFYLLEDGTATDLIDGDGYTVNVFNNSFNPIRAEEGSWLFEFSGQTSGGVLDSARPNQVLTAEDSYTAVGLDDDTDIDLRFLQRRLSRFFVASNTAFDLHAEASDLTATGALSTLGYENIHYRLNLTVGGSVWGGDSWDPSCRGTTRTCAPGSGEGVLVPPGNPRNNPGWTLDDIQGAPTKVFAGQRRTARRPGSIISQAVSFQSQYDLLNPTVNGNNYDLSLGAGELAATVTYTVYAP